MYVMQWLANETQPVPDKLKNVYHPCMECNSPKMLSWGW